MIMIRCLIMFRLQVMLQTILVRQLSQISLRIPVGKTTTPVLMPSLSETTRSGRAVKPKRLIEEI